MASVVENARTARLRSETTRSDVLGIRLLVLTQGEQARATLARCNDVLARTRQLEADLTRTQWGRLDWQPPGDSLDDVLIPVG